MCSEENSILLDVFLDVFSGARVFLFQSALQNATYENGSVAFILRVNIFFDCSCCNSEIVLEISLN